MKYNINKLTPLQLGRVTKALIKQWKFKEGVFSLREFIEKYAVDKKTFKGGIFNRHYFNRLNNDQQQKYEANLAKKIDYEIVCKDGGLIAIPKIVYDVLEFN